MIWAIQNNERKKAEPKQRAVCPLCDEEVIAKCGIIKIWHWAHKKDFFCDSFGEPETPWHFEWKNYFEKNCQEVIIGKHRADIKTKNGLIIEIQNSSISPEQIIEREKFYGNIIWILNGKTIGKNIEYWKTYDKKEKKQKSYFKWKWFPKSWTFATKPIYISNEENLILLKKNDDFGECSILSKIAFIIECGGKPW